MDLVEKFEQERAEIERFEADYSLPALAGGGRQVAWGRMVRAEFLRRLLPSLDGAAAGLSLVGARALYAAADRARGETSAKVWVNTLRPHCADPLGCLRAIADHPGLLPPPVPGRPMDGAKLAKSHESNRLNREAAAFERLHGLPDLQALSGPQRNFGRRCRYEATNTYFLVGLEIRDPAHSLESIAAALNAGLLWLENATAGDAAVMARDPACPEGRVVATGLVDTDHQDVECRSFRVEELLSFDSAGDVDVQY